MKLKILIAFTDKYTDKSYKVGEIVEFDEKRAKELLADKRNLVVLVEEAKEAEEATVEEAEEPKPKRKTAAKK